MLCSFVNHSTARMLTKSWCLMHIRNRHVYVTCSAKRIWVVHYTGDGLKGSKFVRSVRSVHSVRSVRSVRSACSVRTVCLVHCGQPAGSERYVWIGTISMGRGMIAQVPSHPWWSLYFTISCKGALTQQQPTHSNHNVHGAHRNSTRNPTSTQP